MLKQIQKNKKKRPKCSMTNTCKNFCHNKTNQELQINDKTLKSFVDDEM